VKGISKTGPEPGNIKAKITLYLEVMNFVIFSVCVNDVVPR
jgi:hypothetical protein